MKSTFLFSLLALLPASMFGQYTAGTHLKIISQSKAGNFCLDATNNRKADGTPLQLYTCTGNENQRWTVTTAAEAASAIIGTGGYCLDIKGGAKAGVGAPTQLYRCNFNKNQRFLIGRDSTIKEEGTGNCLQASGEKDGASIVVAPCSGGPTEKWSFQP